MSEVMEYKCPCCGGSIEFQSSIQKMKCPYCDTEFEMETLKSYDNVLNDSKEDEMTWQTSEKSTFAEDDNDLSVYVCNSCGGEIVTENVTVATNCPFCDNPVVMARGVSGDLKPDYVIPFKLSKADAKKGFLNHLKGKILLPKLFKDENHIDEIKSIYVPFWLFDADVHASAFYKGTRVRSWTSGNYRYTETSHYAITREGNMGFERVPVDGSKKMPDELMESIEPYDFSKAVDFHTAYLSGYLADRYDVDAEMSIPRANNRIKNSAEKMLRDTVFGYTTVVPQRNNVSLSNQENKYALLPVWLLNTTYKGQRYIFAMNGQTGKFVGNLPIDWGAFWRWFAGLFVGFSAIFILIAKIIAYM
ncbi:MAG: hypothetical protein E7614_00070 [Ruminococcaceae bacterium]|nr:hypothetical protein [Oscillospiraceae bacterium]